MLRPFSIFMISGIAGAAGPGIRKSPESKIGFEPLGCGTGVLLHEIAHQFADEVLGAFGESPHGLQFQKACHLLRANPRASEAYPLLDDRVKADGLRPEDKTFLRIKKLMALATSSNLHEAEAAMAKAHALMAKHNLHLLEEGSSAFETVSVGRSALTPEGPRPYCRSSISSGIDLGFRSERRRWAGSEISGLSRISRWRVMFMICFQHSGAVEKYNSEETWTADGDRLRAGNHRGLARWSPKTAEKIPVGLDPP
jgi:hypothetical protein